MNFIETNRMTWDGNNRKFETIMDKKGADK